MYSTQVWASPAAADSIVAVLRTEGLDLPARLNVLSVSIRPGCEDFATLAYLREARRANITSLYVSNGEGGESDKEGLLPNQLAAVRRQEATAAMDTLGGDVFFLNFPDIVAAVDSAGISELWPADSLRERLVQAILRFKPDLILLNKDRFTDVRPLWHRVLEGSVKNAIAEADTGRAIFWKTTRFFAENGGRNAVRIPARAVKSGTWLLMGNKCRLSYQSLSVQQRLRGAATPGSYQLVYSADRFRGKSLDANLPHAPAKKLRILERQVDSFALSIRGKKLNHSKAVVQAAALLDSIARLLYENPLGDPRLRRDLILWKGHLEEIRNILLGVRVSYRLSETIFAERQLAYFFVDSISGVSPDGVTELYFPGVQNGWIVNEDVASQMPLEVGKEYRLLSPQKMEYDLPLQEAGLSRPTIGQQFYIFIVHRARNPVQSFTYRIICTIYFAPRFTVEVMNPLVAVTRGETLPLRLTNHTRDGVADTIRVRDSLAVSSGVPFRLSEKESSERDTLHLIWKEGIRDGTYLIPVEIAGLPVARFVARKFTCSADTSSPVAVMTGIGNTPLIEGLRRLGIMEPDILRPVNVPASFQGKIVLIDRRALSFSSDPAALSESLLKFAEAGGHVILFSQDPSVWNASPFGSLFKLRQFLGAVPADSVVINHESRMMAAPNRIEERDFAGYVFRRNHNLLEGAAGDAVLVKSAAGDPLVVSLSRGEGIITYVDLEVHAQLMSVNPGMYRLLANLIAFRKDGQR